MKHSSISIFFLFWCTRLFAQDYVFLGERTESSIVFRWAPSNADDVRALLLKGTFLFGLANGKEVFLNRNKVWDEQDNRWDSLSVKEERILFLRRFLFGEQGGSELNQMYSGFALLLADTDPVFADALGLIYELKDRDFERYLLRDKSGKTLAELTNAYIRPKHLPRPEIADAECKHGKVILKWIPQRTIFSSWEVQYSSNSSDWKPATLQSLVPFLDENSGDSSMYFSDSLRSDSRRYYRIRGKTPFGNFSEYSPLIALECFNDEIVFPVLDLAESSIDEIKLQIHFPLSADRKKTYQMVLERSDQYSGNWEKLREVFVSDSMMVLKQSKRYAYYRLALQLYNKQYVFTDPVLVTLKEDGPPAIPEGISGRIDTLGYVRLNWRKNTESDLRGYRIYSRNSSGDEWVERTQEVNRDTFFVWKSTRQTIERSLEVAIAATDSSWNTSALSQGVLLARPDHIPPVKPVWKEIRYEKDSVFLRFAFDDSEQTSLVVLSNDSLSEKLVKIHSHVLSRKSAIKFWLRCSDSSGNSSVSDTIYLVAERSFDAKIIADLSKNEIVLKYDSGTDIIYRAVLYRKRNSGEWKAMQTAERASGIVIDRELQMQSRYSYRLKITLHSGRSYWSDEVVVNY
ncbi:MAG TPA: hypothetical protein PK637_12700 [Flavobacteriales bacterium]|nr:hypothetical protein [Flavobacteriales bacterium]HRE97620.1 hypothetical protein [Flavobacteriales bacterium]HRJ36186.1 hypothetical protein [Flavobacteriales bacterium]HRJ37163.1 hypothetical protein [Flavobacteriales bacterium]